ncbi:Pre-mRNA-splicing factor of RES complex-domain-containing protein [Schizophyllum amplum]|uniref:Pre-mRNA-splicing factor of RES complex-domain-containing protein n=1 Tax=Schizophyllum amplum TaxID=97359 RepID=A0A550CHD9_9AGAR|nr:Pre-mRNA-splicing factor of RES complex-domain-containing protein [Auriculariopsis ampla]
MTDKQAYLAAKYMSGPKADAILSKVGKKKKRKAPASAPAPTGGVIVHDDASWADQGQEEEEDATEAVVASDRKFKKRKVARVEEGSGWATLQEGERTMKEETPPPGEDEQPTVVGETPFTGGLVPASQLRKILPQSAPVQDLSAEDIARAQETVYRDASGRKIDTKAAKAEAARLKREREEKEAAKMEWGKGLVQRAERDKQREEMEKNRARPFSRYADDKELNAELKQKELWNDPAAAFLSKKKSKGPRRPEYTGPPPPPNRYGIKPGYRWDGVDRGNGFEKKLFQAQNTRKQNTLASYQWGAEDM